MKEARLKRNRLCKDCRKEVWGDAEALKDHDALHRFVARSGLSVVEQRISTASSVVDAQGRRVSGN